MAPFTHAQLESVRQRLLELSRSSLAVVAVDAEDVDTPDGPSVQVTVRLASAAPGAEWDAEDFLAIRREARTAAVEALPGQDVTLAYESADQTTSDDAPAEPGAKHDPEETR
ncbi:hypothetical protein [Cellulomonas triticagri]|nr:hypothetical protein [Cellulomonas triticagri]